MRSPYVLAPYSCGRMVAPLFSGMRSSGTAGRRGLKGGSWARTLLADSAACRSGNRGFAVKFYRRWGRYQRQQVAHHGIGLNSEPLVYRQGMGVVAERTDC